MHIVFAHPQVSESGLFALSYGAEHTHGAHLLRGETWGDWIHAVYTGLEFPTKTSSLGSLVSKQCTI